VGDAGTLTHAQQQGAAKRYLTAFFGVYLKGETAYRDWLCGSAAAADALITTQTTEECTALLSEANIPQTEPVAWPNPVRDVLFVRSETAPVLHDQLGRRLAVETHYDGQRWAIRMGELPAGLYYLRTKASAIPVLHE
jgi:hypothetical protein